MTKIEAETLATGIRAAFPWVTVTVLPAPLPSPDSPLVYQLDLRRGEVHFLVRSALGWTNALTHLWVLGGAS